MKTLNKLHARLQKIGIEIACTSNYPWIYLSSVNGHQVTETFYSEGFGFTIGFLTNDGTDVRLTNPKEIFRTIRKYSTM